VSPATTAAFEKFYPRDEAAAIVKLHPRTLTLKAQQGEIDFVRPGNENLYPESAIREFLAKRTSRATQKPARKPRRNPRSK
jgi:hypothetical protein